jgi:elongation factor 3
LQKAGASSEDNALPPRDVTAEVVVARKALASLLVEQAGLAGSSSSQDPNLAVVLDFTASLVADLTYAKKFADKNTWHRCVGVYVAPWLINQGDHGTAFAESVCKHFYTIEKVSIQAFSALAYNSSLPLQARHAPAPDGISEEGELLCNTVFSLAYGALLLLSHTTLKLYRGRRYGILGPNGSGKSTLMRQLREEKVENFPPQDELRCVMVEHALQGEDTSLSVIDFIVSGEFPRFGQKRYQLSALRRQGAGARPTG